MRFSAMILCLFFGAALAARDASQDVNVTDLDALKDDVSDASSALNSKEMSKDIHRHGSEDHATLKIDLDDFDISENTELSTEPGSNDMHVRVDGTGVIQNDQTGDSTPVTSDLEEAAASDQLPVIDTSKPNPFASTNTSGSVYEYEPEKAGIPEFDCKQLCTLPSKGTRLYWEGSWYPVEEIDITGLPVTYNGPTAKFKKHPGTKCDAQNWKARGIRNKKLTPHSNATLARAQDDDVKLRCDCLTQDQCTGSVIFAGRHKSGQEGSAALERQGNGHQEFTRTGTSKGVVITKFFFKVCVWRTYSRDMRGLGGTGFCDQSFGKIPADQQYTRNVCHSGKVPECAKEIANPGPDCVEPSCKPKPSSCGAGVQGNPCPTEGY